MTHLTAVAQRHWRRNWFAFFVDYLGFGLGLTFASTATTLPAFAGMLTDNPVLIGAVGSVWSGGWLLPQVLAANYLTNKPNKYRVVMLWQVIGRPSFLLFVVWLLLGGTRFPGLTLALYLAMLTFFMGTDALVALAWMDLFGKSLSAAARGRLIGIGQFVLGLGALGAAALIGSLLGPSGPGFPLNYAIIFGLACAAFAVSTVACAFIVEPPEQVQAVRTQFRAYLPQLASLLRQDRAFRRVTLVRILGGLGGLATSFYVVYATGSLGLPKEAIGSFSGAATVGTALAGLVLGALAARKGTHRIVQAVTWAAVGVPVLALLAHLGGLGPGARYLFLLLFALFGVYEGSQMLGFFNYVLEIAPAGQRPTYMGLANTISGLLILVPILGGAILRYTSYPVLFGLAALGTLVGALYSLGLPDPRRAHDPTASALSGEAQSAAD